MHVIIIDIIRKILLKTPPGDYICYLLEPLLLLNLFVLLILPLQKHLDSVSNQKVFPVPLIVVE